MSKLQQNPPSVRGTGVTPSAETHNRERKPSPHHRRVVASACTRHMATHSHTPAPHVLVTASKLLPQCQSLTGSKTYNAHMRASTKSK
jgi:hypothetical protein